MGFWIICIFYGLPTKDRERGGNLLMFEEILRKEKQRAFSARRRPSASLTGHPLGGENWCAAPKGDSCCATREPPGARACRLLILRSGLNRTEQQTLLSWKYLMQFLWNIISQLSSLVLINTRFKTWNLKHSLKHQGFPGGSDRKASACNVGDPGSIPGLGRSPGKGNGSPLQYSCLESPMDGGAW